MSGPPVYSRQFGVAGIALEPSDTDTLYISPPGQVSIVREIDLWMLPATDLGRCWVYLFPVVFAQQIHILDTGDYPAGRQTFQWTGRLVLAPGDVLAIESAPDVSDGGNAAAVVCGYSLSP
jgi:hypothetical protein